jgi:hypothetical protein
MATPIGGGNRAVMAATPQPAEETNSGRVRFFDVLSLDQAHLQYSHLINF